LVLFCPLERLDRFRGLSLGKKLPSRDKCPVERLRIHGFYLFVNSLSTSQDYIVEYMMIGK
jgi:hypothetical protein